jgi:hypothetical protein
MPIRTERSESMPTPGQRIAARINRSARRDGVLGRPAATRLGQPVCPPLRDRDLARTGFSSQQTDQHADPGPGNLFASLDDEPDTDYGAHGVFDRRAHAHSPPWWLRSHGRPLAIAGLGGTGIAARGRTVHRSAAWRSPDRQGPPMSAHVTPKVGGW